MSLRTHGHRLDITVTGWITLDSATGQPVLPSPYPDTVRPRSGTPERFALVTSWHGERFHARPIRRLAADAGARGRAAAAIAQHAAVAGYTGLVLDFETLAAGDLAAQLAVARAIGDSARARGVARVVIAIPATDTAAYPARPLLGVADQLLVMLYDQHWPGSKPGPVASPEWVARSLEARVREADGAERVIAALPLYGYRWTPGRAGESVSYLEAAAAASEAGVVLSRDASTGTLTARAAPGMEIWVSDAGLVEALMRSARELGVRRFAFWRLGQEDPRVWTQVVELRARAARQSP